MTRGAAHPLPEQDGPGEKRVTPAVQRFTDNLVQKAFLWAFPGWVRPNHLTVVRFILIPVVLLLLYLDLRWLGLGVFIVAICTDFIDGAMARTRDQITPIGTFIDPVADKLLVGAVLAWIGYEYLVVQIMLAFIALELILTAVGASILLRTRQARPANAFGKTKMVVQSIALFFFLLSGILDLDTWVIISVYLLWVAFAMAILSGSRQIYDLLRKWRGKEQAGGH